MMNGTFSLILPGAQALLLFYAGVRDVQTYTIRNWLVVAVALLAPLYWWAADVGFWPDAGWRIAVAIGVFAVLALAYRIGMMGGGDVKLAAAVALWFTPGETLRFLVVMSLAGGLVTLIAMVRHRAAEKPGSPKIPYGVAIAIGGLWNVAQRFLNHFA